MEFFGTINAVYVFVGSLLLGAAGGMLGTFAVLRKQGLLGDALAHASLPGIAVAFLIMQTKFLPGLLFGALISGLIGAFLIYFLTHYTKIKMDSAMASVLSVFFGVGILLLTYIQKLPLASQSGLETFLFGQAAALLKDDIVWMAGAFVIIFLMVLIFWKELKVFIFDREFARVIGFRSAFLEILFMAIFVAAILMSLQAVGVILTAAIFITPAVSALLLSGRLFTVVLLSTVFGMISGGTGAYLSATFAKMPTGPLIVLVSSTIFFVSFLFAPGRGIIAKWSSQRNYALKVQMENVLGALYRENEKGVSEWSVENYKDRGYKMSILKALKSRNLLTVKGELISFSKEGLRVASSVIEKHRLWETFLVERMSLPIDHVHRDAEEMEHILDSGMVKRLRRLLGYPAKDPHGKAIKK